MSMTHHLDEPGAPLLFASGAPGLVVTDVDSTLITQEVIEELAEVAGTRERVAEITSRAMNGELDFAESLRERVATLRGVPDSVFGDVLASITPTEGAHYLMATSFGHVGHTYDGRPTEPYYECIDPSMIDDDECILAWGMNDEPLPEIYGGPLRLRADSQHGYKMVKWVRRLEWIHDYHDVGDGQGGSREDSGLQHYDARA